MKIKIELTLEEIEALEYECEGALEYEKPMDDEDIEYEGDREDNDKMKARLEAIESALVKLEEASASNKEIKLVELLPFSEPDELNQKIGKEKRIKNQLESGRERRR